MQIELLTDCPNFITAAAELWRTELVSHWYPQVTPAQAKLFFQQQCNDQHLPMAWVAITDEHCVGTIALRSKEESIDGTRIRPDLEPWVGGLVVHPQYRSQNIAKKLVKTVMAQSKRMGYAKFYGTTYSLKISRYYKLAFGAKLVGTENLVDHKVFVIEFDAT